MEIFNRTCSNVDPGLTTPLVDEYAGVPGFSGDSSLVKGNTPHISKQSFINPGSTYVNIHLEPTLLVTYLFLAGALAGPQGHSCARTFGSKPMMLATLVKASDAWPIY